jgi:hypothetical protein
MLTTSNPPKYMCLFIFVRYFIVLSRQNALFIYFCHLSPQDMNEFFFKTLVELIFVNMKLMRTFLSIVGGKNMTFKEPEVEIFAFCNM